MQEENEIMKKQVYEMENLIQNIRQQTDYQDQEVNQIFNNLKSEDGGDYQPMETGTFEYGKNGAMS